MAKRKQILVGLTQDEVDLVDRAVERTYAATRSEWMRRVLLAEAERQLEGEPVQTA